MGLYLSLGGWGCSEGLSREGEGEEVGWAGGGEGGGAPSSCFGGFEGPDRVTASSGISSSLSLRSGAWTSLPCSSTSDTNGALYQL